jgi:hypothetical protein
MERKISITYNWNLTDYPEISNELKERLTVEAEERIYEMRKEFYTSGELHYEDEEVSIYGWWDFREETL